MDLGLGCERSLLRIADRRGRFHVPGFKNDADDHGRPATGADDEDHADHVCGQLHYFSVFERTRVIYSHQQPGRNRAAVVFEPHTSRAGRGETDFSQQEVASPGATRRVWRPGPSFDGGPWRLTLSGMAISTGKPQP